MVSARPRKQKKYWLARALQRSGGAQNQTGSPGQALTGAPSAHSGTHLNLHGDHIRDLFLELPAFLLHFSWPRNSHPSLNWLHLPQAGICLGLPLLPWAGCLQKRHYLAFYCSCSPDRHFVQLLSVSEAQRRSPPLGPAELPVTI